jgi:hypothetical protein
MVDFEPPARQPEASVKNMSGKNKNVRTIARAMRDRMENWDERNGKRRTAQALTRQEPVDSGQSTEYTFIETSRAT